MTRDKAVRLLLISHRLGQTCLCLSHHKSKNIMTSKELAPLQSALDSILSRLSCLESKVGIESVTPTETASRAAIVEGKLVKFSHLNIPYRP